MENVETTKKPLIQAWEDWDEAKPAETDSPKLCKIDDPDCEACQ